MYAGTAAARHWLACRASTFLQHYGVYLWLVALGTAIIWGLSFLMQHWLEWVITPPGGGAAERIEAVGSGNFTRPRGGVEQRAGRHRPGHQPAG